MCITFATSDIVWYALSHADDVPDVAYISMQAIEELGTALQRNLMFQGFDDVHIDLSYDAMFECISDLNKPFDFGTDAVLFLGEWDELTEIGELIEQKYEQAYPRRGVVEALRAARHAARLAEESRREQD